MHPQSKRLDTNYILRRPNMRFISKAYTIALPNDDADRLCRYPSIRTIGPFPPSVRHRPDNEIGKSIGLTRLWALPAPSLYLFYPVPPAHGAHRHDQHPHRIPVRMSHRETRGQASASEGLALPSVAKASLGLPVARPWGIKWLYEYTHIEPYLFWFVME